MSIGASMRCNKYLPDRCVCSTKPVDAIQNARNRGAIDYVAGVKVGDNPYLETDARHWAWIQGWATAGLERS